jgi:3-oxoacyl-[acyl-carrier-protein] synthase-3
MDLLFNNKKISGILTVLPKNKIFFDDEIHNYHFSEAQSLKLKKIMGFNSKRVVANSECISDLAIFGLSYLFDNKYLRREDVDAIIVVSQTADFIMPPTSNYIHGYFNLKEDAYCLDINQGCSGYLVGLFQSYFLLSQEHIKKVVLINADVLSRKVSKTDRNSNPLIGDAAAITVIENSIDEHKIYGSIKNDGKSFDALIIPAGGMKLPSSTETSLMREDAHGNFRSLDNLVMKGDEVFNFIMTKIPPMINEILKRANKEVSEIDYFLFHQPNKFLLSKLAEKIGIPGSKLPSNIVENFGNASGASIPTAISYNLQKELTKNKLTCCLAGFGVGLTWAAQISTIGPLDFNIILDY